MTVFWFIIRSDVEIGKLQESDWHLLLVGETSWEAKPPYKVVENGNKVCDWECIVRAYCVSSCSLDVPGVSEDSAVERPAAPWIVLRWEPWYSHLCY